MSNQCLTDFDKIQTRNASLLSVLPGFGQLRNGQHRKGILFLQILVLNLFVLFGFLLKDPVLALVQNAAHQFDLTLNESFVRTLDHIQLTSPIVLIFAGLMLMFIGYAIHDAIKNRPVSLRHNSVSPEGHFELSEALGKSYVIHLAVLVGLVFGVTLSLTPKPAPQTITLEFAFQEADEKNEQASDTFALKSAKNHGKNDPTREVSRRLATAPSAASPASTPQEDSSARPSPPQLQRQETAVSSQQKPAIKTPKPPVKVAQLTPPILKKSPVVKPVSTPVKQVPRQVVVRRQEAPRAREFQRPRPQMIEYQQTRRAYSSAPSMAAPDDMGRSFNQARDYDNQPASFQAVARPNFGAYMRGVERRMKQHWAPPPSYHPGQVMVFFKIHSGGDISNLRLARSSGMPAHDRAALRAVRDAAPFRALPAGAPSSIQIEFAFDVRSRAL